MDNKRLDEAVEVALSKYFEGFSHGNNTGVFYPEGTHEEAMRSALLASLPVLLGEPVAWLERGTLNSADPENYSECKAAWPGVYDDWFPVYAPSLGEGHE